MPVCVIFPPDGAPIMHLPTLPDGHLSYIEAWSGSVLCEQEPDGEFSLHGFVLGCSGGLPPDQFGLLIVVPRDNVEEARVREEPGLTRMREHRARMRRLKAAGVTQ